MKYTENNFLENPRITSEFYRNRLISWQVPAIQKHIGDLTDKVFIDIGAGDIVLGEVLDQIGKPRKFYVQDLNKLAIESGLQRLKSTNIDTSIFSEMVSHDFDFSLIKEGEIDAAFSNSLFSHLSINSIILCLRNLSSKMKAGSSYFTSMIVLPDNTEKLRYDWSYLKKKGSKRISSSIHDPYHYTEHTLNNLQNFNTGFELKNIHDYGHPFQKLVEFSLL